MLTLPIIGAMLILLGFVYMAGAAIYRGRMSDPHIDPTEGDLTLRAASARPGLPWMASQLARTFDGRDRRDNAAAACR
jgi:hypothetical protein